MRDKVPKRDAPAAPVENYAGRTATIYGAMSTLRMRTARLRRFVEPCRPSKAARPPSGPQWVHEIKFDRFRLLVRRDGARVRCFTRNGHDWADRFLL